MQILRRVPSAYSSGDPLSDQLYHDEEVLVTVGRVEMAAISCSVKFISTITLHESPPSRIYGWTGLGFCALASGMSLLYLYTGKLPIGLYIAAYLLIALITILIIFFLLWAPALYRIELDLVNGQKFKIARKSKSQIDAMHAAIKEAVARNRLEAPSANAAEKATLTSL